MASSLKKIRLLLGVGLLLGSWSAARADRTPNPIPEISIITPASIDYFNGWPTVTRLRSGELVVVWSGGRDAHSCPLGRVESMVSTDEGANWSWPRVLFDSPLDDRDAGILETAQGTLLLSTFSSVGYRNPQNRPKYAQNLEAWKRFDHGKSQDELSVHAGPAMLRSTDGGHTWSAVQQIPVSSPHGPIQLRDGRLLFPGIEGVGKGRYIKPGERKMGVWESTDEGREWKLISRIPARQGDNPVDYHELHGVEAVDGTIVVLIRSHSDPDRRQMLQTDSKDGGRTWSEPRQIGIRGYPPHLLRLRDDRLLLSYDSRIYPFGTHARVSADSGVTWSEPVAITQNRKKLDQGYPSTAQLKDGSLLTIWYEKSLGATKAVLKQAKWKLPDSTAVQRAAGSNPK